MALHASGTFHVPAGAYRNLTATFVRYRDASRAHSRPFGKGACFRTLGEGRCEARGVRGALMRSPCDAPRRGAQMSAPRTRTRSGCCTRGKTAGASLHSCPPRFRALRPRAR